MLKTTFISIVLIVYFITQAPFELNSNSLQRYTCGAGDLELPSAFSPNKDGKNDVYCLQGWAACVKDFSIVIFNRWGEALFESTDPNFCWDGVFRGKTVQEGVYVCAVKCRMLNGENFNKNATITVLQ